MAPYSERKGGFGIVNTERVNDEKNPKDSGTDGDYRWFRSLAIFSRSGIFWKIFRLAEKKFLI